MAINKKHAFLIFTEMILNDFKTQLQQIQAAGVMYPMVANIEMRPCLISVARRRLKSSTLPSAVKPAGSQKPTGAWTPSSFSNAVRVTWHENGILTALLHSAALLFFLLVFWKKMATVTRSGSSRYHRADHGEHNDIDIMVSLWTAHGAGDDSDV